MTEGERIFQKMIAQNGEEGRPYEPGELIGEILRIADVSQNDFNRMIGYTGTCDIINATVKVPTSRIADKILDGLDKVILSRPDVFGSSPADSLPPTVVRGYLLSCWIEAITAPYEALDKD